MASPFGGIDPQLLAYIQAMSPSEEDKKAARNHAMLTTGLGMMQNAYLNPVRAIGYGGLLGANSYNDELKQLGAQRAQNMAAAAQAMQIQKQSEFMNMGRDMLGMGQPSGAPPTALAQGQAMPTSMSQGASQGMPAPMPQGSPPMAQSMQQPSAAGQAPPWANPRAQMGMAFMSGDPKKVADVIGEQMKPQIGPDGTIFMSGKIWGRMTPQGAIIYQNGDPSQAAFIKNPQEALAAVAEQAGMTAGATKKAELPYQTMTLPQGGKQVTLPSDVALAQLRAQYAPQPPQYTGATQAAVDAGQIPPKGVRLADWQAAMADAKNNPGAELNYMAPGGAKTTAPMPGAPPLGVGLDPLQEAELKKRGETLGEQGANYNQLSEAATEQSGRTQEMRKLIPLMPFGATAPMRTDIAKYALDVPVVGNAVANALIPNASTAVPAAQTFGKMANQMVIEQSKQLGTREAASVIQMVANSNPNQGWTRPAAQTVMDYLDGSSKWKNDREVAAQSWRDSHGQSLNGFAEAWNKTNPLTSYIPPLSNIKAAFSGQDIPNAATKTPGGYDRDALINEARKRGLPGF